MVSLLHLIAPPPLTKGIVAHAEPEAPGESRWHLFNDFLVRSVSTEEALAFNTSWKVPSVIAYQIKDENNKIDTEWKNNIDTSILYQDFKYAPARYKPYVANVLQSKRRSINKDLSIAQP
jgi:hypothetical protein